MPGFCLSHSLSSPSPGKQGSRGAASHHAASLARTLLPKSVPPGQAGRENSHKNAPQWWCRGGCKAPEQRGAAVQTSLGCLRPAGDLGAPPGEGRSTAASAASALAGTGPGASRTERSSQQAWKNSSAEGAGAGEVGFWLEQYGRLWRRSGVFQGVRTGPCPRAHFTSLASPVSGSQPGKLGAHIHNS